MWKIDVVQSGSTKSDLLIGLLSKSIDWFLYNENISVFKYCQATSLFPYPLETENQGYKRDVKVEYLGIIEYWFEID